MFNNQVLHEIIHNQNKRQFFRVYLDKPLCSKATIVNINGKNINIGYSNVCVNDIGPGGLLFTSNLDFPMNDSVVFRFKTRLLNSRISLEGKIVRKILLSAGIFKYGVSFEITEEEREQCVKLFNDVAIALRRNAELQNCSFCNKENFEECLKSL